MEHGNLAVLLHLVDDRTALKPALYLGDQDVPGPWGQLENVLPPCAELSEAGARPPPSQGDPLGKAGRAAKRGRCRAVW